MLKNIYVLLLATLAITSLNAQQTSIYTNELSDYYQAINLYHNKAYAAAQESFSKVKKQFDPFSEMKANCDYYIAIAAIKMEQPNAEQLVTTFVENYPNSTKRNDAYMDVANFYYDNAQYAQALKWLQKVNSNNLSQSDFETYLFKNGYALFATNNKGQSKKFFIQLLDSQDYGAQAKYYYGYVAYEQDDYENANKYLGQVAQDSQYKKDVSYFMSDLNFKSGKFQQAIDAALPLLNTSPPAEKSEINKIIGESYFNLGQYAKAIPYLKEYKGKKGKWTNTDYYLLGYAYYKQNDYLAAIEQFNKIIDGNNAVAQNAYYHLAECYLKTNKKTEALNAFRNAGQMDFKPQIKEDANLNYAKLSYEIGNPYKNVADVLQDFVKMYPNSPERENVKKLIISAYVSSSDYEGAIKYMESEKQNIKDETYQKVTYERGIQLFLDNQFFTAVSYFNKSLTNAVNPKFTAKSTFWKAESNYQLGNYTEAIQDFLKFKNMNAAADLEENQNVDYHLAYAYFKKKDYANAIDFFSKYTKKSNFKSENKIDAYLRLGDTYFVTSQYQKAIDAYETAATLNTKTADYATFQSAVSYGFIGKNDRKITLLNQLLHTYKNSLLLAETYYVLGTTYTTEKQNAKAIESYDKLIKNYPNSSFVPRAFLKKGLIYYNQNQPDKAIEVYKLAVKNYPNTPIAQEAVQNARQIYIDTGRVEEYATWVKDLKFVNISNIDIDNDLYESAEKPFVTNDYIKAITGFKKYLQTFPNGIHVLKAHFYLAQSLENQNQKQETITHYQYVANQPQNEFTEQALVKLSQVYLDRKDWNLATPILQKLEQVAERDQNVLYAQSNLMKSYYNSENFSQAVNYADKVLKNPLVDNKVKADAQIIIARAAIRNNDGFKARQAYKLLESVATGELKAEALFYDAFFKNQDGDFKNSNIVVQKIAAEYASHKYWGAKSLVVMAKNFYGLKDAYQATYILESVIKNFRQYPDVVSEAETELKKIKSEQAKTNDSVIQK